VVPGVIGSLQALEALKIASGMEPLYSQQLLLFDALGGGFRTIRLRPRQPQCAVCGENPSITALIDYELFCGSRADDKEKRVDILDPELRVSPQEYSKVVSGGKPHLMLDVREEVEYQICHLPHSRSILPQFRSMCVCVHNKIIEQVLPEPHVTFQTFLCAYSKMALWTPPGSGYWKPHPQLIITPPIPCL
jgi:hypothetical protein